MYRWSLRHPSASHSHPMIRLVQQYSVRARNRPYLVWICVRAYRISKGTPVQNRSPALADRKALREHSVGIYRRTPSILKSRNVYLRSLRNSSHGCKPGYFPGFTYISSIDIPLSGRRTGIHPSPSGTFPLHYKQSTLPSAHMQVHTNSAEFAELPIQPQNRRATYQFLG
jgi:hypothetical protein